MNTQRKPRQPERGIVLGQKVGKLTVKSQATTTKGLYSTARNWNCDCECGGSRIVATASLNKGSTKTCGNCPRRHRGVINKGEVFGRLTVITYNNDGTWKCNCSCGEICNVFTTALKRGDNQSCGCLFTSINDNRLFEPQIASARRVWKRYKRVDNQMNIAFEEFLVISQQNCAYCGVEPNNHYNDFLNSKGASKAAIVNGMFDYNGLDRIDSSKAHITCNVVSSCYNCNRAKNDRSTAEFLAWIDRLIITPFIPITIVPLSPPNNIYLVASIKHAYNKNKKVDTNDIQVSEYYALSQMDCFYCGRGCDDSNCLNKGKPKVKNRTPENMIAGIYRYNGLDRIDRNFPHNKDNVVPCCYWCNFAKMDDTLTDFYAWITRVQQFQERQKFAIVEISSAEIDPINDALNLAIEPDTRYIHL